MIHGHIKPQRACFTDPLGRTIDTLCAAHVNVEKLDGTVIIADCNARFRATLV
jgi:hypothetical protein